MKPCIAVTLGDVTGIGPEVVVKALLDSRVRQCCQPVIYGPSHVIEFVSKKLAHPLIEIEDGPAKMNEVRVRSLGCISQDLIGQGRFSKNTARLAMDSIVAAANDASSGKVQALVTAPVHKESMRRAGFNFIGHTELLAALTHSKNVVMMMIGPKLKVALVTTHVPVRRIAQEISYEKVLKTISLVHSFWVRHRNQKPRIAVTSLNPHGGEDRGKEEKEIERAVRTSQKKGLLVEGPTSSDALFYRAYRGECDVVIAMYHDQGLIPVKMLDFDKTVNMTLGLPFVRTSPDHGTAFDIAGLGLANPESMIQAIRAAASFHGMNLRTSPAPKIAWQAAGNQTFSTRPPKSPPTSVDERGFTSHRPI